ncbi:MAG: homing endonuclease associated repeat-containing protein [Halorubrum sp.]
MENTIPFFGGIPRLKRWEDVSNAKMAYSDEELLADIRAVAAIVERTPSIKQYRDHGEYAATTITRRFESWQDAVARAGFEPHAADTEIPADELRAELRRLADEHDQRPTVELMNDEGRYWVSTYRRQFGSWTNALTEAGFEPADARTAERISDEDLLAELERMATDRGATPTFQEMERDGAYSPRTYVNRFGSWNEALEAADLEPRGTGRVSEADLLADLRRLRDELGTQPIADDVRERGAYSLATYQRRFGSWSGAKDAAFDE